MHKGEDGRLVMDCPHAQIIVEFLRDIGLSVAELRGASGFIEHVEIAQGGLLVDPQASASNLLHESGHLAIVPQFGFGPIFMCGMPWPFASGQTQ